MGTWVLALGTQGFLDTNMLVLAAQTARLGGGGAVLNEPQNEWVHILVEYRLKSWWNIDLRGTWFNSHLNLMADDFLVLLFTSLSKYQCKI